MAKVENFEDLIAWQKARILTREVYLTTRQGGFVRDFGLSGQIQRAAVSVMSNIAEGFERGGDKEFVQFLSTAKGSCGEVRSQLYVALDQGYIPAPKFREMYDLSVETSRVISGFMNYLSGSQLRGSKFRK